MQSIKQGGHVTCHCMHRGMFGQSGVESDELLLLISLPTPQGEDGQDGLNGVDGEQVQTFATSLLSDLSRLSDTKRL